MSNQDISKITPQDLRNNPTLLLHKRGGTWGPQRTPFDGKVGAVIEDGNMFVISANMEIVYRPPLGTKRVMHMREDFRFGDDDPWQWPQPYSTSLCHFAAIPRQPLDKTDPMSIMWWTPTREFFVPVTTGMMTGVGMLDKAKLAMFHKPIQDIQLRFDAYRRDPLHPITNYHTIVLANSLAHSFERLEFLPSHWRAVFFGVTQVQRCFLELTASLDYLYIYKPRMDGQAPAASAVAHTIGAFAFEATVVQEFVLAGLPVWTVHKCQKLAAIRINNLRIPCPPEDLICLTAAHPSFTPFFTGTATDHQKYVALSMYMRSFVGYPNPFESTAIEPTASSSITAKPPRASNSSSRPHPYSKKPVQPSTQPKTPAGRNKFADLSGPLAPLSIPAWRNALASVNTNIDDPANHARPGDAGYVFPDPGLFLGTTSTERQAKYFFHWLKHRTDMIYRLTSARSSAAPVSTQLWRDLLNYGGLPSDTASEEKHTKAAARRRQIITMLGDCMDEDGVEVSASQSPGEAHWRGQQVSASSLPSHDICCEVLWELSELNFRFELLALDQRASSSLEDYSTRQDRLLACLPARSLLVADIKDSSRGLAAEAWNECAPFLLAMARLMREWVNVPSLIVDNAGKGPEDLTQQDVISFESIVATFYTQSFFNFFARAAMIPRRL